jgi:hypothetical protein
MPQIAFALPQDPAAVAPNLLSLVKSLPDYKFLSTLIERDPFLVDLYTNVKDVTCVLVVDSAFPSNDPNGPFFSDLGLMRAIFQYILIEGNHPSSSFTSTPQYLTTKLTNSSWVNTSQGKGIIQLFSDGGKKVVRSYSGRVSEVTEADLKFNGGLLHKLNVPTAYPSSFTASVFTATTGFSNYALSNASSYGLLKPYDDAKDVTIFTVTNAAWQDLISKQVCFRSLSSVGDILKYHVIMPGVYYAKDFDGRQVKTLEGATVTLSKAGNNYKVNEVNVAEPDVFTKNGVYHVLDKPLSPPGDNRKHAV